MFTYENCPEIEVNVLVLSKILLSFAKIFKANIKKYNKYVYLQFFWKRDINRPCLMCMYYNILCEFI